jgi:hypothetical protein
VQKALRAVAPCPRHDDNIDIREIGMEMELAAALARITILEAGLRAALRMHPVPDAARDEIQDAAERALLDLGDTADEATPEHVAAMSAITLQAAELVEALEC